MTKQMTIVVIGALRVKLPLYNGDSIKYITIHYLLGIIDISFGLNSLKQKFSRILYHNCWHMSVLQMG